MSTRKWLNLKLVGLPRLRCATVCLLSQWVNIMSKVAGKVVHHVWVSPTQALIRPPDELFALLFSDGEWRAVIRSVLHHPTGQNGRDDTCDLWIIYQRWRLSHRIKNVALAQMTFSHHRVLITQCHEDPPLLLPHLTTLMSGHAVKYDPKNYNFKWLQMPCLKRCIKWSHIWYGEKKRSNSFPLILCITSVWKSVSCESTEGWLIRWSNMPFKQKWVMHHETEHEANFQFTLLESAWKQVMLWHKQLIYCVKIVTRWKPKYRQALLFYGTNDLKKVISSVSHHSQLKLT